MTTTLWAICGAGSGVGKTHLALALCRLLPEALYVKCGCGKPAAGKAKNYFTKTEDAVAFIEDASERYRHVVLENNSLVLKGFGDIVIFIDAVPGHTDVRPDADALRSRADIAVGTGAFTSEWKKQMDSRLMSINLCGNIIQLLKEQNNFILNR